MCMKSVCKEGCQPQPQQCNLIRESTFWGARNQFVLFLEKPCIEGEIDLGKPIWEKSVMEKIDLGEKSVLDKPTQEKLILQKPIWENSVLDRPIWEKSVLEWKKLIWVKNRLWISRLRKNWFCKNRFGKIRFWRDPTEIQFANSFPNRSYSTSKLWQAKCKKHKKMQSETQPHRQGLPPAP